MLFLQHTAVGSLSRGANEEIGLDALTEIRPSHSMNMKFKCLHLLEVNEIYLRFLSFSH